MTKWEDPVRPRDVPLWPFDRGICEGTRDDRHRHAVHHRMARMGMAEVVKADILDVGLAANPMPE